MSRSGFHVGGLVEEKSLVSEPAATTVLLSQVRSFSSFRITLGTAGTVIFREGSASGRKVWQIDESSTDHKDIFNSSIKVGRDGLHITATQTITSVSMVFTPATTSTPTVGGNIDPATP